MPTNCPRSSSEPSASTASAEVVRIGDDERAAALSRLLGTARHAADAARVRSFLAHAAAQSIDLSGLYAIRRSGTIDACALVIPGSGRTAMLFPSEPAAGLVDAEAGAALVTHACRAAAQSGALVQSLLEPGRAGAEAWLPGAGLRFLADLSYLERPLSPRRIPESPHWPDGIHVRAWDPSQRDQMITLLEATYVDTKDCPGLHGLRAIDDILDGHLAAGRYEPALWQVLFAPDGPCGLLLISPSHSGDGAELVYLGLVPAARGRGLGRALLRHSLRLASTRALRTLTLAVDDANKPATELYTSEGFRRIARRRAWILPPLDCAARTAH